MKKTLIVFIHLGYWLLYLILVFFLTLALFQNQLNSGHVSIGRLMFCTPVSVFFFIPAITGFYLFYLLLFPRYLQKRKIIALCLGALVGIAIGALCGAAVLSLRFGKDFMFMDGPGSFTGELILMALLSFVHGIIALVIRGFISWYGDIRIKAELDKKNYDMEVALIKAQINPHFLFNTINNIDVLIKKDADKASDYLNKLSEILRFTLYETNVQTIELSKELAYIGKFVELQKIRSTNPNYVQYITEGEPAGIRVEPMLFIPFVENAFKHTENKKAEGAINIHITIKKEALYFVCSNTYSRAQEKPEHSGLGNELIRRRLELLYPGKYTLDIKDTQDKYTINLVLSLGQ